MTPSTKAPPASADLSLPAMALVERYSISRPTAVKWKRDAGYPILERGGQTLPCPKLANLSGSLNQVARRYGVSPPTARRWKVEAGLPVPAVGRPRKLIQLPKHCDNKT